MIIAALLLGVCQIIGFVALALLVRLWADRKQREIEARIDALIRSWTVPPEEGKPHKLAELVQTIGAVVGQSAAHSIMASLNADKSHVARVANGLSESIEAQQNPVMALLAGGKRGKGAALARLAQLLGPGLFGGAVAGKNGEHGQSSELQKRIGKGG